jgi:hypothetical protein
MKTLVAALLPVSLVFITSPRALADSGSSHAESVSRMLQTVVRECPERIWPTFKALGSVQFLMTDEVQNRAWLWNAPGQPEFHEVPVESLPSGYMGAAYKLKPWNGIPTATFALGKPDTAPVPGADWHFSLITHEATHGFVQPTWNGYGEEGGRGPEYPFDWRPRYYRARILRSLLRAYRTGSPLALAQAAHWRQEMIRVLPGFEDDLRQSDRLEGIAQYAEVMADAVFLAGCGASEATLRELIASGQNLTYPAYGEDVMTDANWEYYDIGMVSGLLLRSSSDRGFWEIAVEAGASPVELLLRGTAPTPDAEDPELAASLQAQAAKANAEYAVELDPLLEGLKNPFWHRVSVPRTWSAGFGAAGFAMLKGYSEPAVIGASLKAKSPAATSTAVLSERTLLLAERSPCGDHTQFVLALSPGEGVFSPDSKLTVDVPSLKLQGHFHNAVSGALTWTCLTD